MARADASAGARSAAPSAEPARSAVADGPAAVGYDRTAGYHRVRTHPVRSTACSRSKSTTPTSYTLCRPVGELDAYTVASFREALGELATAPRVVIDLSEVPFMDSAGLGALIGGIRRAREHGGEVAVACSRPTLTRLLHTTGFDRIVPVTETLDAAVAGRWPVAGRA